jgi:hypothetical protein
MLAAQYDATAIAVMKTAFPAARYWDSKMGELHTMPDCAGLPIVHLFPTPLYMYINEDRVPWEATGPCSLFGGMCQRGKVHEWSRQIVQVQAFAPKIKGLVFVDTDRSGPWIVYHFDATCTFSPLHSNKIRLAVPPEWAITRDTAPCSFCFCLD